MEQFEQLSISDQRFPSLVPVKYSSLNNDGKIYTKIDWLTVMFFDCSLNDVLRWIHLEDCVDEFIAGVYEQSRGYDEVFRFVYNYVLLETSKFNYYGSSDDVSIFNVVVPKIRLDLSGSALDYLRSLGLDMDTYRLVRPELPEGGSYHVTRCDWAFDLINYKPEFLDRLIDHIQTHKLKTDRIPLASTHGAIGFKLALGGQKTVYLGSSQSDKLLRVYDKRLQFTNRSTGTYVKDNPYDNPDSWIRIEWQTRNKYANNLALSVSPSGEYNDFKKILKCIFEHYAFADGRMYNKYVQRSVVDFWNDLFDWKDLESRIIQNAKYVEPVTAEERLETQWERNIQVSMFWQSKHSRKEEVERFNKYLRWLEDPENSARFLRFLNRFNECNVPISDSFAECERGFYRLGGRLYFK